MWLVLLRIRNNCTDCYKVKVSYSNKCMQVLVSEGPWDRCWVCCIVVATFPAPERTVLWLVHPSVHFNLLKNCYNIKLIQKHDMEDNGQQGTENRHLPLHCTFVVRSTCICEQFAQSLNVIITWQSRVENASPVDRESDVLTANPLWAH